MYIVDYTTVFGEGLNNGHSCNNNIWRNIYKVAKIVAIIPRKQHVQHWT